VLRRILTIAASAAVLLALTAGSALATGLVSTMDQSQTGTAGNFAAGSSGDVAMLAQTFTAGANGPMDEISVNLTLTADPGVRPADEPWGTVVLSLYETDGTNPTEEMAESNFMSVTGWNNILLDPPLAVTTGTVYMILLKGRTGSGVIWNGTCNAAAYKRGIAYAYVGDALQPISTYSEDHCPADFAFRSYVQVAPSAKKTPGPTSASSDAGKTGSGDLRFLLIAGIAAAAVCVPLGSRRFARR
jgi:hypothetical protein